MKTYPTTGRGKPHAVGRGNRRPPRALLRLMRPAKLRFTLRDDRLPAGARSTADLLDAALHIVTAGRCEPGDQWLRNWWFGAAVRAVAQVIIAQGHVWFPMRVALEKNAPGRSESAFNLEPLLRRRRGVRTRLYTAASGEPLRLVLNLEEGLSSEDKDLPLGQVLDAAFNVFDPGFYPPHGWRRQRWFFHQVLRAVCEAVVDAGELPPQPGIRLCRHHEKGQQPAAKPKVRALALALQPANPSPGR